MYTYIHTYIHAYIQLELINREDNFNQKFSAGNNSMGGGLGSMNVGVLDPLSFGKKKEETKLPQLNKKNSFGANRNK